MNNKKRQQQAGIALPTIEDFNQWCEEHGIALTEPQRALCESLILSISSNDQIRTLVLGGAGGGKTFAFITFEQFCHDQPNHPPSLQHVLTGNPHLNPCR